MGCPNFTHRTAPSPSMITTRIPYPLTNPTHHPKWHPDPISHFATVHFLDRWTDQQTGQATCLLQ